MDTDVNRPHVEKVQKSPGSMALAGDGSGLMLILFCQSFMLFSLVVITSGTSGNVMKELDKSALRIFSRSAK
ncbi:MAG TPA: hypothetical protein ENL07_06610 [Chlorobaculum parvum]|uniref:Uncharacterized protein n=1 Tax=Chlorobaculum parvum TaxID=274539 RepID=A0A7C5DEE5_9CHLB|nr:hypothetical protein [Chlorobaculum parvum]